MVTTEDETLHERLRELEEQNRELRRELTLLRKPADGLPGNRVVVVFFSLIALSVLLAAGLWTLGKRTARERAARAPVAPAAGRVEQAGQAIVRGLHRCVADSGLGNEVDIRLEARLVPAGTLGLVEAVVKPVSEQLVPCVRQIPGAIRIDAEPGEQSPTIEVRYLVEHPQESSYQARWSWRLLP